MPARKLTPAVVSRAQQLRSSGWTLEQIAQELGISLGSARNACRAESPPAAAPDTRPIGEEPPAPPEGEESPVGDQALTHDEVRAQLASIAKSLQRSLDGDLDLQVQLSISRVLPMVLKQIVALTPPPPPKHDEHPDMIAAANEYRTRLHEALQREAARRDAAPKCGECGAPQLQVGEESPVQQLVRWCLDG